MFERSCLSPALDIFAFLDQRYGVMPKHAQHWIKSTARMHLSVRIIGAEIHTYLIIHVGLILAQLLSSFAKLSKMNTRLNFRIQKVLLRHLIRLFFKTYILFYFICSYRCTQTPVFCPFLNFITDFH